MKLTVVLALILCVSGALSQNANTVEKNRQTAKRLISEIYALDGDISSCNSLVSNGKRDEVSGLTIPLTRADSIAVNDRKIKLIIKISAKIDSLKACYKKAI